MSDVFISYRHVRPDADVAAVLDASLRGRGWSTFLDSRIGVGTAWAHEIDQQLRAARFFVVLLSPQSIVSAMVRQEVELAHRLRTAGGLRILPVKVGFDGELPYDLAAYLNPIQHTRWEPGTACEPLVQEIVSVIERGTPEPDRPEATAGDAAGLRLLAAVTEYAGAPLPAADPRLETGTMRLDSPFYVRREADQDVERLVGMQGSTTIVSGPRQVGKSSLITRALRHATGQDQAAVYVDFQLVDERHLRTLGEIFWYLAGRISRVLNTHLRPADVWDRADDSVGEKEGLADFIHRAVLATAERPVVLVFDEVDRLFDRDYRDDFFATVRGWHNHRAIDDGWARLNIVLAHATEPGLWIRNLNQSPFNVGERIRVDDFTAEQVSSLNARHRSPLPANEIETLMRLLGGHPYLVRHALYLTSTGKVTLAELVRIGADDQGPFGDHLRGRLWSLRDSERLRAAIRTVLRHGVCRDEHDFQALRAAGFVRGTHRDESAMRCELYRDYFERHL